MAILQLGNHYVHFLCEASRHSSVNPTPSGAVLTFQRPRESATVDLVALALGFVPK